MMLGSVGFWKKGHIDIKSHCFPLTLMNALLNQNSKHWIFGAVNKSCTDFTSFSQKERLSTYTSVTLSSGYRVLYLLTDSIGNCRKKPFYSQTPRPINPSLHPLFTSFTHSSENMTPYCTSFSFIRS